MKRIVLSQIVSAGMSVALAHLLASCSPEEKLEEEEEASTSSSMEESDSSQEYLEAVQGTWGRCLDDMNRYVEIQFKPDGFAKRIVIFKTSVNQESCKAGDERFEVRTTGTYEIKDDHTASTDFDIIYHNQEISLQYYDHDEVLEANGVSKPLTVVPVCQVQLFKLGTHVSMLGDQCRDPYVNFLQDRLPIVAFDALGKLLVNGNRLIHDFTTFDSIIVDRSVDTPFVDEDTAEYFLDRKEQAYQVEADYSLFSDISQLKQAVQGTWSLCSGSTEVVLTLGASEYVQTATSYYGGDCSGSVKRSIHKFTGTYEIVGYHPSIPGGFSINWYEGDYTLQPLSLTYTDMVNATGLYSSLSPLCQDLTFTQGVASSLVGKTCDISGGGYEVVTTPILYDMMLLHQDGTLYDSDPQDGEAYSADKRVSRIDWYLNYSKVQ